MISGPVFPRTRTGLWELLERHADQIERGLVLLESDVGLEPGGMVDAIARDAAGQLAFLFLATPESALELPARVLAACSWAATGLPLLARLFPRPGFVLDLPPRAIVVGFECPPSVVQQLQGVRSGVEILQVHTALVGGRLAVGVVPLHGGRLGDEDSFRPPSGLREPLARTLAARFLDLLRRLDPTLEVQGDRYWRAVRLGDSLVAELGLRERALRVWVPAGDDLQRDGSAPGLPLTSDEECADAGDRAMRRYLQLLEAPRPGPSAAPATLAADGRLGDTSASLERLRRSVHASHLSPEEYSALGESPPAP